MRYLVKLLLFISCAPLDKVEIVISAVSSHECEKFCVEKIEVTVVDAINYDIIKDTEVFLCGDDISIKDLPVGKIVRVKVMAYGGGVRLLEGESSPVTIPSDAAGEIKVYLGAVQRPKIDLVEPFSFLSSDGVIIKITGRGFGKGDGLHQVTLDNKPLKVLSWSDDQIDVEINQENSGTYLVVQECGVSSNPFAIRGLSQKATITTMGFYGCLNYELMDGLSQKDGNILLLVKCQPPTPSYLQKVLADICMLSSFQITLSGQPSLFTLDPTQENAWVVYEDGRIGFVSLKTFVEIEGPTILGIKQVSASSDYMWALVDNGDVGGVYRIGLDDVQNFKGNKTFYIAGANNVVVAIVWDNNGFYLKKIDKENLQYDETWPLVGCKDPMGLVVSSDGMWIVASCEAESTGLFVIRTMVSGSSTFIPVESNRLGLMGIDLIGKIIYVFSKDQRLYATDLGNLKTITKWEVGEIINPKSLIIDKEGRNIFAWGKESHVLYIISVVGDKNPCVK